MPRPLQLLLVEDSPSDARLIRTYLGEVDPPPELQREERLQEALSRLAAHHFDCVLLDLNLPDSSGLQTFERIRAAAPDIPTVILSGLADKQLAVEAVRSGAQDYLVKNDLSGDTLARSIHYAVERNLRQKAERSLAANRLELDLARHVQQQLFPREAPQVAGFDLAADCVAADGVSGDYFDYVPMRDGCLGLVVGDVSGHGMGPALLMAETRALLRALAQTSDDVGHILTLANRLLALDTDDERFVTAILCRIDPARGEFQYAAAGHVGHVIARCGTPRELPSTGLPLGVSADEAIDTGPPSRLGAGDLLLLSSDGVAEADGGDKPFGTDRMLRAVAARRERPAAEIVAALREEVRTFIGDAPQQDDVTILVARRTQ